MNNLNFFQNEKEKGVKSIWIYHQRESKSNETVYDSDFVSVLPESNNGLFDLDIDGCSYLKNNESTECVKKSRKAKDQLIKLQMVVLEPISIPSTAMSSKHIVNLKQSFTFPGQLKPSKQTSTQTSQINLTQNRLLIADEKATNGSRHDMIRPLSLPPENVALTNLEKRVQADVRPKNKGMLGDGDKLINDETKESKLQDADLGDFIQPTPTQCLTNIAQPISSSSQHATPKFKCKKVYRPPTKYTRKRQLESRRSNSQASTMSSCGVVEGKVKPFLKKGSRAKKELESLCKKPENLLKFDMKSDLSTDGGLNDGSSYQARLSSVIDKFQDQDW